MPLELAWNYGERCIIVVVNNDRVVKNMSRDLLAAQG